MKTIYSTRSQNGRWGFDVISADHEPQEFSWGRQIFSGTTEKMTTINNVVILKNSPQEGTWTLLDQGSNDYTPVRGCKIVHDVDVQGGKTATVATMEMGAIFMVSGYKDRRKWFMEFNGEYLSVFPEGDAFCRGIV